MYRSAHFTNPRYATECEGKTNRELGSTKPTQVERLEEAQKASNHSSYNQTVPLLVVDNSAPLEFNNIVLPFVNHPS
jgi:hypothetical protein